VVVAVVVPLEDFYEGQQAGVPTLPNPGIKFQSSVLLGIRASRRVQIMLSGRYGGTGFCLWMMERKSWQARRDSVLVVDRVAFALHF
jgi:hypothetical protein